MLKNSHNSRGKTQISLMHFVRYHKVYCKLLNLQKITQKQRSKEFVQNTLWIKSQKTMKSYQRWMENRMKNSKRFCLKNQ